jgi:hypothetical protein
VTLGCSEGYYHGISTVEREGAVALVVKGAVCANLGFSTSWHDNRILGILWVLELLDIKVVREIREGILG